MKQLLYNSDATQPSRAHTLFMAYTRRGLLLIKNRMDKNDKNVYLEVFAKEATAKNILRWLPQHRDVINGYIEI